MISELIILHGSASHYRHASNYHLFSTRFYGHIFFVLGKSNPQAADDQVFQ